jgi:hypothetical protein
METLAVIAWKYPILQSEVIKIRHNKAYEHMKQLKEMGFVVKEKSGRTFKIKLTDKFFNYFDLPTQDAKDAFKKVIPEDIQKEIMEKEKEIKEKEKEIEEIKKTKGEEEEPQPEPPVPEPDPEPVPEPGPAPEPEPMPEPVNNEEEDEGPPPPEPGPEPAPPMTKEE